MFGTTNTFASRRVVSLPEKMPPGLRIPIQTDYDDYEDEKRSSLLPLSTPSSPGRTARRLTMGLRLRAERYYIPLLLISLCLTGFYFFATPNVRSHGLQGRSRFHLKQHDTLHLPSRNLAATNGVSLLSQDEDELIAEDDLFWDKQPDHTPLTDDEKAAEAELHAHQLDVLAQNRMGSLRALIWWIAEGGVFPADWEIPSKAYLKKVGARGMERLLEDIDAGTDEEAIFEDGWADFAKRRYRIVVFSKSYCPYSRKAKGILEQYHLTPAPFVIELDQRPDTHTIQTLLDHLTGRRTVPNVIFDFVPIGGSDDTMLLHSEGGLQRQFSEMGVIPGSPRRPIAPAKALPEHIPPPNGGGDDLAAAPAAKNPLAKGPPAAPPKKVNALPVEHAPIAKPAAPAPKKAVEKPAHPAAPVAAKKPVEKPVRPVAQAQEVFNAAKNQLPLAAAPLAAPPPDDDEMIADNGLAYSLDEDILDAPAPPVVEDDTLDVEDDGDDEDEPMLDSPALSAEEVSDVETQALLEDEDGAFVAPAAPVYDDMDEDDDDIVEIPPGATPAEIRAAIQAAHGDEYLYQSDDEGPTDSEDVGYVGDLEMLRNGMPMDDPPPPPPSRPKAAEPANHKVVEAAAKKVLKVGAEKVGAAVKNKAANAKDRVDAARKQKVEAVAAAAGGVARKPLHQANKKPILVPPKKIEAVAPPAKKPPVAVAPKKVEAVAAPPRNRVEAVAQKKAQAAEAIANKKAEVAVPPKKKGAAAPAAAPAAAKAEAPAANGAAARRMKGMDKVDAREVLKPGVKKAAAAAAAPPAGAAAPPPAKKDPNAIVKPAGGKKAMKLAPKDAEPPAKRVIGGKGAKRPREPVVEVDLDRNPKMAKKAEEPAAAKVKARKGGAVVGGGREVRRAAQQQAAKPQAAKRKGKVL